MPAETGQTDIAPRFLLIMSTDSLRASRSFKRLSRYYQPYPSRSGTIKDMKFVRASRVALSSRVAVPASNIKRQLDQTIELPLNKYRRGLRRGYQLRGATVQSNEADAQLIGTIQNGIRSGLIASVATTTAAAKNSKTPQAAIANLWATLTAKFGAAMALTPDAANHSRLLRQPSRRG